MFYANRSAANSFSRVTRVCLVVDNELCQDVGAL